jgi:hypothetical protein
MFEDNSKKTLFWVPSVSLEITLKERKRLVAYRTANDHPPRDIKELWVDDEVFGFVARTTERYARVPLPGGGIIIEPGEHVLYLENWGDSGSQNELIQLEYLEFEDVVEEPEPTPDPEPEPEPEPEPTPDPEPEPDPEPRTIVKVTTTIEWSDGEVEVIERS